MLSDLSAKFSSRDLAKIVSQILGCTEASAVEVVVLDLCRDFIGADYGHIVTWDVPGKVAKPESPRPSEAFDSESARVLLDRDLSAAGSHVRNALFHNDVANSPWAGVAWQAEPQLDSLLVAGIANKDKLIGLICLGNKRGGFGPADAELAADFAELAAVALANRKAAEMLGIFQALSDSSPIGIYIVQSGRFQFVNPQFQRLTGYDRDELIGRDALDIVAPADRELVREHAVRMLKGRLSSPYEYRIVNKAGELRWILETVGTFEHAGSHAAIGNFIDITERKALEDRLAHMATHDPLTGLPNRRVLEEAMARALSRAKRGKPSALLFLDVDNFKLVNDRLGHSTGDDTLVQMVQLLQGLLRAEDILARVGGDEFAVLLEGTSWTDAWNVAERLRAATQEHSWRGGDGKAFNLGLSIGIAPIDGTEAAATVLSRADRAMYRAKAEGGDRVVRDE